MFKVAFIGGGINSAVGQTHQIAMKMDNKFEIVAGAFSRNKEVNLQTANKLNLDTSRIYQDYKVLLENEKGRVDAVVVLVPTTEHKEVVNLCIEEGYPVICEKSLALTSKEAKEIINKVDERKGFLCVTYNYTGYPMVRVLKNEISKGALGKINHIEIQMPQEGFIRYMNNGDKPKPQNWRMKDNEVPVISLDLGTHLHNMVYFLTKEKPLRVIGNEKSYGFFENIIDNVNCTIEYTNNMSVQMWYSKAALGHRNGIGIQIYGSSGSASWYQGEPEVLKLNSNTGETRLIDRSNDAEIGDQERYGRFKIGHPAGFMEAFANYYYDIYDVLEQYYKSGNWESEYIVNLDSAAEGIKLFEEVHKSSVNKCWVDI